MPQRTAILRSFWNASPFISTGRKLTWGIMRSLRMKTGIRSLWFLRMLAQAEEVPFTLEDENGRLYLVEKDGSRLDITEAAATDKGYRYAWKDEDGKEHQAFALGTPEEHFIAFSANSVEIDADGTVSGSTNAAIEGK